MHARVIDTRVFLLTLFAVLSTELAAYLSPTILLNSPMATLGLIRLLQLILVLFIVAVSGPGMDSLGLARRQTRAGLKRGLVWAAAFGLFAALGFILLYALRLSPLAMIYTPLPRDAMETALFFLVGGLIAPVAEEVVFRGIAYGFLRRWGILPAVAGSAVIFVLAHSAGARIPVTQIVGGVVFALAYEFSGSLMAPITIHALGNTTIFALSLIARYYGSVS